MRGEKIKLLWFLFLNVKTKYYVGGKWRLLEGNTAPEAIKRSKILIRGDII